LQLSMKAGSGRGCRARRSVAQASGEHSKTPLPRHPQFTVSTVTGRRRGRRVPGPREFRL